MNSCSFSSGKKEAVSSLEKNHWVLLDLTDMSEIQLQPVAVAEGMHFIDLLKLIKVVIVQSLTHVRLCDPKDCSTPGFPVLHYL